MLDQIDKINEYLEKQLWMDFEMYSMNRGAVEIVGFLDEAGSDKIKIKFEQPYMILCSFSFSYSGEGQFISIVEGKDAYEINKEYKVTVGNIIFKISNTNIEKEIYIIAKDIKMEILE